MLSFSDFCKNVCKAVDYDHSKDYNDVIAVWGDIRAVVDFVYDDNANEVYFIRIDFKEREILQIPYNYGCHETSSGWLWSKIATLMHEAG